MISGGFERDSVEVLVPSSGLHCQLPPLPEERYYHTMQGLVVCGGGNTQHSCITLSQGAWNTSTTLLERR